MNKKGEITITKFLIIVTMVPIMLTCFLLMYNTMSGVNRADGGDPYYDNVVLSGEMQGILNNMSYEDNITQLQEDLINSTISGSTTDSPDDVFSFLASIRNIKNILTRVPNLLSGTIRGLSFMFGIPEFIINAIVTVAVTAIALIILAILLRRSGTI